MGRSAPRQMATSSADSFSRSERKGAPYSSSKRMTRSPQPGRNRHWTPAPTKVVRRHGDLVNPM